MKQLSAKATAFCEEYVRNGHNGRRAYLVAYDTENKQVASNESTKLLKDPRVREMIEAISDSYRQAGFAAKIDKKVIMRKIADMLEAKKADGRSDYSAINNAITTYAKLTGDFTEKKTLQLSDKRELNDINPNNLSEEEIKELEKAIMADL